MSVDIFNFDFQLPLQPDTKLDPKVHVELQRIYNSMRIIAANVGGGNLLDWTSEVVLGNISGWSTLNTAQISFRYLTIDTVLVSFHLSGISSTDSVSFLLPSVPVESLYCPTGLVEDNSILLAPSGQIAVTAGDKLVRIYKDLTGAVWTAGGNKSVAGQFIYRSTL